MPRVEFDFDRAVFCYFMEHAKAATVQELAEYAGVSVSKVRKIVASNKYESNTVEVDRPVRERNYGTIRCYRRVYAYRPSLTKMREEIIDLRNKLKGLA